MPSVRHMTKLCRVHFLTHGEIHADRPLPHHCPHAHLAATPQPPPPTAHCCSISCSTPLGCHRHSHRKLRTPPLEPSPPPQSTLSMTRRGPRTTTLILSPPYEERRPTLTLASSIYPDPPAILRGMDPAGGGLLPLCTAAPSRPTTTHCR